MPDQSVDDLIKQYGGTPPAAAIAPGGTSPSTDDLIKQYGGTPPIAPTPGERAGDAFNTSFLGPDYKPDFSTTVYSTPLPSDQPQPRFLYTTPEGKPVFDRPMYTQPQGTAAQRLGKGWWEYSLGGLLDMIKSVGGALNPITPFNQGADYDKFIEGTIQSHKEEAQKAQDALRQRRYSEAVGHALASALPFYGPAAAHVGETAGGTEPVFDKYGNVVTPGQAPDVPQAIGQTLGLATQFSAPEVLPRLPGAAIRTGETLAKVPDIGVSPEKSAAAQQVINLGQKYDVPLTAGDISQAPGLRNMEVSLEKVPFQGMQKLREEQQVRAKAAATGIKSQYEQKLLDTDQSSLDELEQAAGAGDERARNVLGKMQEAGNDPDRIIQASIGLGDWTTRQTANELYDNVQKLAEEHNLGDVPLDATGKAINSSLQQLLPAKLRNNEVIGLLQKIKESISPTVDDEGKQVMPDNSYGLIRQLHSDLGERIREYYQGNNALIGEKGVGHLERVQNALEDDMRNYAEQSNVPEIVDAGRQADNYYKTARVPYKNGMLASAAVSNEPDQIFQQFIKAGKGDRAQNFYDALDDKGRAAVRYNMVAKAVDDAVNPQSGIFSPQKFFTSVEKLDDAYGVFFKAKDKAEIQGFQNLMGHVTRAGQFAENPPTGQRVIPYLIAGAAAPAAKLGLAHPVGAAGVAALFGAMRALFTTPKGQSLLLRLQGIKPGAPLMDSVWQEVGREMPKLAANPPEEPPEQQPPPSGGGPPSNPPQAPAGKAVTIEPDETTGRATGESVALHGPAQTIGRTPPEETAATSEGTGKDGTATEVLIPGGRGYDAHYQVRELSDIQPSHNGVTFQPNPQYGLHNTRDYNNPENRGKVVNGSLPGTFSPRFHITDNPDATNGPIVVDRSGNAIGGNGRTMILQRVYANNPEGAQAYRDLLTRKASQFGIDPAQVAGMKEPVLVREVDTGAMDKQTVQNLVTDLNKVGTAALTPSERAIADSRRVSPETLDFLGGKLEAGGPDATIASTLEGKTGAQVLDKLIADGVISPQERAAFAKGDELTPDGKTRISKLVLGRFFADPAQMDTVPAALRNKIERIAAPLAKVERQPEWNLTPDIREAVTLLEDMRTRGAKNIDDMLNQSGLFGDQQYSPRAVQLAKALQRMNPNDLVKAARQYASDGEFAAQGPDMFGNEVTPQTSLEDAFKSGRPAGGGGAGKSPTTATFYDTLQNHADAAIDRMRKRGTFSGTQLNAGVPIEDMRDMAIWGAAKFAQGVIKFKDWSKEMLNDIPAAHQDRFRAVMPVIYRDAQEQYGRFIKATANQLPNTRQLIQMFNDGRAGAEWYDKTRAELHRIFGREDGDMMVKFLAATSPNTTVPSNVTLALKAFKEFKLGQEFAGEDPKDPGYLPVVKDMLNAIRNGEDLDQVGGLKVQSFRKNLMGEADPVTIDRWMKRIFNFKSKGSITDPQYKFMDYQVTRIAKQLNMEPRQVQAAMWKAIRESSGETSSGAPFEELINKRLAKDKVLQALAARSRGRSKP